MYLNPVQLYFSAKMARRRTRGSRPRVSSASMSILSSCPTARQVDGHGRHGVLGRRPHGADLCASRSAAPYVRQCVCVRKTIPARRAPRAPLLAADCSVINAIRTAPNSPAAINLNAKVKPPAVRFNSTTHVRTSKGPCEN